MTINYFLANFGKAMDQLGFKKVPGPPVIQTTSILLNEYRNSQCKKKSPCKPLSWVKKPSKKVTLLPLNPNP